MSNCAIVGINWGDEGKGRMVDLLTEKYDCVVRYQGGGNAGHTVVNPYGKFALHLLPSGIFRSGVMNVLGNGVALDGENLLAEIRALGEKGVAVTPENLRISERASLLLPWHRDQDVLEERRLADKPYGSTHQGIAPFYSDKYAKVGWQVNELFQDDDTLLEKIDRVCVQKNILLTHLYHRDPIDRMALLETIHSWRDMVEPYVGNVSEYLEQAVREDKTVLLEGQLGTLKDPDHGIYPMVTSSSTLAAFGAIGAGIAPYDIRQVVVVNKAYSSAVGAGEFVSEIFGDEADELRRRGGDGGEFGATTGRPRRMGWYDCVASRYGCRLQGATDVAFTVLDVLGYLDEIPVCVAYEIDGVQTKEFPVTRLLARAKPVYVKLPGWKTDIRGIKKYEDLPENCRRYIEFIEKEIGYPITMVSNGPSREDILYR